MMFSFSPIPDHAPIANVMAGTVYDYGALTGTLSLADDPPQKVINIHWAEAPQRTIGVRYE